MSEPMTRREFLKKAGWATVVATGASLISPFFKSGSKVEGRADADDLSHKATVLETDNTLEVENAAASIQVECKGRGLSTFVFTEQQGEYPSRWPRIFTDVNGKPIELLAYKDDDNISWYIPGEDVQVGEKGIKGAIGAEFVLMHQNKYKGNDDNIVRYWPPHDGKAESINFNEQGGAYKFSSSDLPEKVRELLFT